MSIQRLNPITGKMEYVNKELNVDVKTEELMSELQRANESIALLLNMVNSLLAEKQETP